MGPLTGKASAVAAVVAKGTKAAIVIVVGLCVLLDENSGGSKYPL
jgi:hypothetical protein